MPLWAKYVSCILFIPVAASRIIAMLTGSSTSELSAWEETLAKGSFLCLFLIPSVCLLGYRQVSSNKCTRALLTVGFAASLALVALIARHLTG